MVISKELEKLCEPLLVEMQVLVVICMYCRRFLEHGSTHGMKGGFSHGFCKPLCQGAIKNGWK